MKVAHNSIWCYLFFTIVIAYALKGLLYPTGTISIAIALVELLICSFYLIKTVFFRKRAYIVNSLLLIIGVVTLSYLISHKSVLSTIFGRISTLFLSFHISIRLTHFLKQGQKLPNISQVIMLMLLYIYARSLVCLKIKYPQSLFLQ